MCVEGLMILCLHLVLDVDGLVTEMASSQ